MFRSIDKARILGCTLLLLLSACGGGGGGGGGGNGSSTGSSPPPPQGGLSVITDKAELRFATLDQSAPSDASITFSLAGTQASGTYYAMAEPDGKAVFETFIQSSSLTSITVGMRARSTAASVDGAINFKLCKDEKCADVVWSRAIPYRIRTYRVDTTEVALTGFQGATTTALRTITPAPTPGELTVRANTYNGTWLSGSIDAAGQLVIAGSGAGLARGNYTGDIFVTSGPYSALGATIRVAMSVDTGVVLPANGAITIDMKSPSAIGGTVKLGFNGVQSPAWSVSSNKPWLIPASLAGTGAATLGYTVDTTKLADLANFDADTGTLSFKIAGQPDVNYQVVVEKKLPELLAILPAQVVAGRPSELRLRGRGLRQLASIGAITLGGTPLASGTIVSDTEASVSLGSLAAGAYQFGIPGVAAIVQPRLDVVAAPQIGAAVIQSMGMKSALAYSAVRSAMYTVDRSNGKLLRYSLVNQVWTLDKSLPVESTTRLGLTPDERTLYTNNGGFILEERDPDTLAVRATYEYKGMDPYLFDFNGRDLPITNDGRVWFGRDQWSIPTFFDSRTRKFVSVPHPDGINGSLYSPVFSVSRDGSRMVVESSLSNVPTLHYDPVTGKLEKTASSYFSGNWGTVLSGNGKYVMSGMKRMYEIDTWRLVGQLPEGMNFAPVLLSNDGSRLYVAIRNDSNPDSALKRFDVMDTVSMTKIGEIPLASNVTDCSSGSSYSYGCADPGHMLLTPFGDAIIWFSNTRISIIPVPMNLGGGMAAARFKLAR